MASAIKVRDKIFNIEKWEGSVKWKLKSTVLT